MSSKLSRRKCRCCSELFRPDYRHGRHQFYCAKADCRRASKAASQRRWLRQKGNRNYFRDPDNSRRVQQWRKEHPGYWRKKADHSEQAQVPPAQLVNPEHVSCNVPAHSSRTLQDVCLTQDPVFVGLISMVTGSTLQEEIASTARSLLARGRDILGLASSINPENQSLL
jgi:hypothetical protein